ncbi:MAG TPA: hypothetical protein VKO84_10425 [Gaiellaceae bacterium]|nr:hypothetical protein [Gaiellaceae bacterium]
MTSSDEERRAANEATFRDANERIREAELELSPPLERVPYLCECDDVQCRATVSLTAREYEHVRENGATFAVLPAHVGEGDVIEEHGHYVVVLKSAAGGEVARSVDPRGKGTG